MLIDIEYIYNIHKPQFCEKFNGLLKMYYYWDDKPIFIFVHNHNIKRSDIKKEFPDSWVDLITNSMIKLKFFKDPLFIYNQYQEIYKNLVDNNILLEFNDNVKPKINIKYFDKKDIHKINKNMPFQWCMLERYGIIDIKIMKLNDDFLYKPPELTNINYN